MINTSIITTPLLFVSLYFIRFPWPSPTAAAVVPFSSDASLFACPSTLGTPTQLPSFTGGRLLLAPTSKEGDLCILTRVNRNVTKKVYIPIARSYDGSDWHRIRGKYISYTAVKCGEASDAGSSYNAGDYLCEVDVPVLAADNVGYFLTSWEDGVASDRRVAARFLERASWGAKWDEIINLENEVASDGKKALAQWVMTQQSLQPSSHRKFFRERLNPRTLESYQYGIPGPKACEKNARYRRFAFTYLDLELSRGTSGYWGGNTGLPFTPVEIETISVGGVNHYAIKFGGEIRTILPSPLQYEENGAIVTLADGSYTICHVEEVVSDKTKEISFTTSIQFQLLVGDLCTSSYTNRGGVEDGKGDGATSKENIKVGSTPVRFYDKDACDAKCGDASKVKLIQGGNPEVFIPDDFAFSTLSWIDLSALDSSEIFNINAERTQDSSWLLTKDLDSCTDENGDEFPDPTRLANTDYFSYGHGKYNLDKPIFAKLPGNMWALHDFRTQFKSNTPDNLMEDGGGAAMKAAARSGNNDDGNPDTDLVVRCSNVQRNVFNEATCRISYHEDACVSVPLPDPEDYRIEMQNPEDRVEHLWKYVPNYAGPEHGGVVICGSENEVAPIPTEDDYFDVTNRKVQPGPIDYEAQRTNVFVEVVMSAEDQLCQRLAFGLSKIFATSTTMNSDSFNSETNIAVYDNFVTSCFSTYKDVMKKVSFNQEMSEQLTFKHSKSVANSWHRSNGVTLAWPDENYARENLQLHSIGLTKLDNDGTEVLDNDGKPIANYGQEHIFSAAKVWTSFKESFRRGNYEDLDGATISYLDPLQLNDINERDWFPKITADGGYLGDKVPLCSDLPERHFLKKGAKFRLLGGSSTAHNDPLNWEGDEEVHRMKLQPGSQLYQSLCNPTSKSLPSSTLSDGTGIADYDSTLFAPLCQGRYNSCDSNDLLSGRVGEVNGPNTIDGCADGQDSESSYPESIKRIVVSSVNGDNFRGGDLVKVQATVISFAKLDRVDLYYTSDASSAQWKLITTVSPLIGEHVLRTPYMRFPDVIYTLPKCLLTAGCKQAVRVVLRSSRDPSDPTKSKPRNSDGLHKPDSNCATSPFDDVDDLIFEVLPSLRPKDACLLNPLVTLDSNLECHERECTVSTLRVVEVIQGVFYEYLHLPCVHLPFYNNSVKVFSGSLNNLYMCADKSLSSARSTCCGTYSDRGTYSPGFPTFADLLSEYRGERLTYAQNEVRCTDWSLSICDPERIGPMTGSTGHCQHRQSCRDVQSSDTILSNNAWHWTTGSCKIQVKIHQDGKIAILHNPEDKWTQLGTDQYPAVQSHVNINKTVSYFDVHWDTTNIAVGKLEYPHVADNACDGGTLSGDYCICDTTLTTSAVFDSLPTRDKVLSNLFVGAWNPIVMYPETYTALVETTADEGVSVYKQTDSANYSEHTIFRVKGVHSNDWIFLKNVLSTVSVCDGTYFFRNSPTFYDLVDPQLESAYHEVDAYLDHVDGHDNTPPFICLTLSKHFGYSNPSPDHIIGCSDAYKAGVFTWTDPKDPSVTLSFGSGSRGDLKAVSASILLSRDALSPTLDNDPSNGGLKEPLHKLMQIMRGLEFIRSPSHRRTERLIAKNAQDAIGQVPYGIPDQFAFFSPDYSPPGAHIESALVSPEAELLNMKYVIATQNAFYAFIQNGLTTCWGGIGPYVNKGIIQSCGEDFDAPGRLSFKPDSSITSTPDVIAQISSLLTADRLDNRSRSIIESVYEEKLDSKGEEAALTAAKVLMVSSPAFHATNNPVPKNQERIPTQPTAKDENEPYKAVIHLNLFGGMDSMNLLVPHPDGCQSLYNEYKNARGENLYLKADELIKIDASASDQPCTSFGVNKNLGLNFVDLFNEKELIFFANIGHLQKPVTASNFLAETKTQLFSHHTLEQESFKVDAFKERGDTGVLGRMTDILDNRLSTRRIAIDGSSNNLVGDASIGLKVDVIAARGPDQFYINDAFSLKQVINHLNNATAEGSSSIHAELFSQSLIDSQDESDTYAQLLESVPDSKRIDTSGLGKQLNMILKLVKLNQERDVNRDTFALTMSGFDTHFDLKNILSQKLIEIGANLRAFRDDLVDIGLWNNITLVVSSEMGRTITPNTSDGTDHGWGGIHFVMGGHVNGGTILGHYPDTYSSNWKYNTGRGVWIPTTSNEGMWYGIAQWFGVESNDDLEYVLPNLNNFGCRLYSESNVYVGGIGKVPGCGGDVMSFSQDIFVSNLRESGLNPEDQKHFCNAITDFIKDISIKCVILDQVIATRVRRLANNDTNDSSCDQSYLEYRLSVSYEISSDSSGVSASINDRINSSEFKDSIVAALGDICLDSAAVAATPTQSPSYTPSTSPNTSSVPSVQPTIISTQSPSYTPSTSPNTSSVPSVQPTIISATPSESSTGNPSKSSSSPPSSLQFSSPTATPSKSPSQGPSRSPSLFIATSSIEIESSFSWNRTCTTLSQSLLDVQVIEQSIFTSVSSQLEESQSLDYVVVTEICNHVIPTRVRRWSQIEEFSNVIFSWKATQRCNCSDLAAVAYTLFAEVNAILQYEVDSGNLTNMIQLQSQGNIDAVIQPGSIRSSFNANTNHTSVPSLKTTIPSSKSPKKSTKKESFSGKSSKSKSSKSSSKSNKTKGSKKSNSRKKKRIPVSFTGESSIIPQGMGDANAVISETASVNETYSMIMIETSLIKKRRDPVSSSK